MNKFQENNNKIIIISGYAGHGKSTFIKLCKEISENTVIEMSTIDWPLQVASYCGADIKNKDEKLRKFLSELKTALENYDGSPSNKVIEQIKIFVEDYNVKNYIFFVNIREALKIEEFKTKCKQKFNINCKTLFINCPNKPIIKSNESDKYVKQYKYDYYIRNDGNLDILKEKAKDFLNKIEEVGINE